MKTYSKIYDLSNSIYMDRMPSISVTSVCESNCIFCMNKYNPFETVSSDHRSLDEISEEIFNINLEPPYFFLNKTYQINGTHTCVGDPLLHPQIFDVLKMIRERFQNTIITVITTGEILTEDFIEKLSEFKPMIVHISLSSTNKEQWMKIYNKTEEIYYRVMNSLKHLQNKGIYIWPLIVPMINKLGFEDIENTFKTYKMFNIDKVFIINPSYSKFTPISIRKDLEYDIEVYNHFIVNMLNKYNFTADWFESPYSRLVFNYIPIIKKLIDLNKSNKKSYWFTSVAAYDRLHSLLETIKKRYKLNIETIVIKVENRAYGGNINCSSLWMVSDIRDKIDELGLEGENIVIPNSFIDEYGFDMMRENIQDYFKVSKNQITIVNIYW